MMLHNMSRYTLKNLYFCCHEVFLRVIFCVREDTLLLTLFSAGVQL